MTEGNTGQPDPETITITDKRKIDPDTGEVRDSASGPAPDGSEPEAAVEPAGDETADQVAELTDDLKRVQADFANYRKRALRDQQAAADRAKAAVVGELLSILDDLDRARGHGDLEAGPLKAFADKITDTLTSMGLTAFGAAGDDFDPALHEAVHHEGDGGHPVIGDVLRKGYLLGEQVLRHAMVSVLDTVAGEADPEPGNDAESGEQQAES